MKKTYYNLIKGIRSFFKKNKLKNAVIGLSGGIDSSLAAYLVAKAMGNKNLFGILMPEIGVTKRSSIDHAVKIAHLIGINFVIQPINDFLRDYKKLKWEQSHLAEINTKARIRATILYNYANAHNAVVIGTSNRSELMLGYFTKYGDGAVDVEIIGDLYKKEVFELAKYLKLPKDIITKEPSAELYHGHTDAEELGASYEEIDKILKTKNFKSKLGKRIKKRIDNNKHKTSLPIIIKK